MSVEVDGLPRHVADVRQVNGVATEEEKSEGLSVSEDARCNEELSDQVSESQSVNKFKVLKVVFDHGGKLVNHVTWLIITLTMTILKSRDFEGV